MDNRIKMEAMKANKYLKIGLIMLLISWLMTGLSVDDEFYEDYSLFIKHRPSLQFYFRSPLGMEDMPADYPAALRQKEAAYDEFVLEKHWSDNYGWLALIWILLNITILITGIIKWIKTRQQHERKNLKME